MAATDGERSKFIIRHTALGRSVMVPEIKLYLATEITPLWQASEAFLAANGLSPPFWAFAWPGSEALARYVTDRPALVAGRRVLDFAAGCGLAAIAAAKAGAAQVEAAEIDPLACAAIALNAQLNDCRIEVLQGDVVGQPCRWDVILTGDVCYEAPMTRHILPWLRRCARTAGVLIADPGRAYRPRDGIQALGRMAIPTSLELEESSTRLVTLLQLQPDR
jgi:predicted nicotinamide N-methyase